MGFEESLTKAKADNIQGSSLTPPEILDFIINSNSEVQGLSSTVCIPHSPQHPELHYLRTMTAQLITD